MSAATEVTRWWIAPPAPDESLRSLLGRAAAFYECEPHALWHGLHQDYPDTPSAIDDPSPRALRRLGQAMGVSCVELHRHRLTDAPWLLDPTARASYCPQCEIEHGDAKAAGALKRDWAHVLRTHCPIHAAPLQLRNEGGSVPFIHEVSSDSGSVEGRILTLIERFGSALECSLFFRGAWPNGWRGDCFTARSLLLRTCFNFGTQRAPVALADVCVPAALRGLIHGPPHLQDPLGGSAWEAFRRLGDPAQRRAALWVAAWHCIPDLPGELSPGWVRVPMAPMGRRSAVDAHRLKARRPVRGTLVRPAQQLGPTTLQPERS